MKPAPPFVTRVTATPDPRLVARVLRRVPLVYEAGPAHELDRPAHVRAGSGLARLGERLVVVQDDANFLALIDPLTGCAHAVVLPAGVDGARQFDDRRGNKRHKLDLEACFVAPNEAGAPLLVALGSGSSPRREQVVVAHAIDAADAAGGVDVYEVPAVYEALRTAPGFAPGELNVEGAIYADGRVRLFGRGNGAARDGRAALNATCELDWPALRAHVLSAAAAPAPVPTNVVQYELGELDGLRLGFTDATTARAGRVLFAAAAEDSPDATRDGRVAGSALGVLDDGSRTARWTAFVDHDGRPFTAKVEGVLTVPGGHDRLLAVVDQDDPDAPSELCEVELTGPWLAD